MIEGQLDIREGADVSAARQFVREVGGALHLSTIATESVAIIMSELATNQLRHAGGGRASVRPVTRDGVVGIEIEMVDHGQGLADPKRAFAGVPQNGASLGIGLAGVWRLSLELDLDTRIGEGTRILARRFDKPVRRRPSVTILGRPIATEPRAGDAACFWRTDDSLLVMLSDGVGHGVPARVASDLALATTHFHREATPDTVLTACNVALRGSRGAVLALARLDERGHAVEAASMGNIEGGICHEGRLDPILAQAGVVGASWAPPVRRPLRLAMPEGALLVMATDGTRGSLQECGGPGAHLLPPWELAQRILDRRVNDDAMVVVVK